MNVTMCMHYKSKESYFPYPIPVVVPQHVSLYHSLQVSKQTILSVSKHLHFQKTATASLTFLSLFLIHRFLARNGFISIFKDEDK